MQNCRASQGILIHAAVFFARFLIELLRKIRIKVRCVLGCCAISPFTPFIFIQFEDRLRQTFGKATGVLSFDC